MALNNSRIAWILFSGNEADDCQVTDLLRTRAGDQIHAVLSQLYSAKALVEFLLSSIKTGIEKKQRQTSSRLSTFCCWFRTTKNSETTVSKIEQSLKTVSHFLLIIDFINFKRRLRMHPCIPIQEKSLQNWWVKCKQILFVNTCPI